MCDPVVPGDVTVPCRFHFSAGSGTEMRSHSVLSLKPLYPKLLGGGRVVLGIEPRNTQSLPQLFILIFETGPCCLKN